MRSRNHLTSGGFTLVELLISLTLSLFLLGSTLEVYLSQKKNYQWQEVLAHLQERGRLAIYLLSNDLQSAGYLGCATHINYHVPGIMNVESLRGYTAEAVPEGWGLSELCNNTDAISFCKAQENSFDLISPVSDQKIVIPLRSSVAPGDILMLSDCEKGDVFRATSISNNGSYQRVFSSVALPNYPASAVLSPWIMRIYYIASTSRKNSTGQKIPALYMKDFTGRAVELVEGVENMQISYGVRGVYPKQFVYLKAQEVRDWQKVLILRISLLVTSIDEVTEKPVAYEYLGKKLLAGDRLLRHCWEEIILLRERLRE